MPADVLELTEATRALERMARTTDAEVASLLKDAVLYATDRRMIDAEGGAQAAASILLELEPHALGRSQASPSLQDRITSLVTDALRASDRLVLLDLAFSCGPLVTAPHHPYRDAEPHPEREPAPDTSTHALRAVLEGYFDGHPAPPQVDITTTGHDVFVTIHTNAAIYSQLAPRLRTLFQLCARRVLVQRAP